MPYLKTLKQVYQEQKKFNKQPIQIKDTSTEDRSKFYNSKHWKKVRNIYIQEHPLCELCQLNDIVKPAEEIHHLIKFHQQYNDSLRWKLLTDTDNLISLCRDCHNYIHKNNYMLTDNQQKYITKRKDDLSSKYLQNNIVINYTTDLNIKK